VKHWKRSAVLILAMTLLMGSTAFSGTWVPYEYDNSNAPKPIGNAEKMTNDAGPTYANAKLKASVLKLLGIGWMLKPKDGTATAKADCTVGMRVLNPCTTCYSYAWSAACEIGRGSEISAKASALGWLTGAWGTSQGACVVFGDLAMKDKNAIAVDDEGSGGQVEIAWPASLKIKTGKVQRTNNSDQEPFAGNNSNKGQGTEVQVRFQGYSKVKGHAEVSALSAFGSYVKCEAESDIVTIITMKGFRAPGKIIIDSEVAVPAGYVTWAMGVLLYDPDPGVPAGECAESEGTGVKPVRVLDTPPSVPEGRDKGDFTTPDDWTE